MGKIKAILKKLKLIPGDTIRDDLNNSNLKKSMEYIMNLYDVNHSVKLFTFIASVWKAVKDSLADDGKFTIGDSLEFFRPVKNAFPAFSGGNINFVTRELFDEITEEEQQKLLAPFKERKLINVNQSDGELADDIFEWIEVNKKMIKKYVLKDPDPINEK